MKPNLVILFCLLLCAHVAHAQTCISGGLAHYKYDDVKIILDNIGCNSCHSKSSTTAPWHYESYKAMFKDDACGQPIITPAYIDKSSLIDKINGGQTACGVHMPLGSKVLSPKDLLAIELWVTYGAPEHCIEEYNEIKSILDQNKCGSCHYGGSVDTPWSYQDYNAMLVKDNISQCSTPNIVKRNAAFSFLYQKIIGNDAEICGAPMLHEGQRMSDLHIAKIRDWINAGAPRFSQQLPVTLSQFEARSVDNQTAIDIFWKTESELNTELFDVEYSINGYDFYSIGILKSQSSLGATYTITHNDVAIGFNYYRLKMIDFDGSFSYSPIRVVRIDNETEIFTIKPNLIVVNDNLIVDWYPTDERETTFLKVMDISGRLSLSVRISYGINRFDVSQLTSGVYYVVVEDYNLVATTQKIVICR
jgi:hypothetical protein